MCRSLARSSKQEAAAPTPPGYVVGSSEGGLSHEVGHVRSAIEYRNALATNVVIEGATCGTEPHDRRAGGCGDGRAGRCERRRCSWGRCGLRRGWGRCGLRRAGGCRHGSWRCRRRACGDRGGSWGCGRGTGGNRCMSGSCRRSARGSRCGSGGCRQCAGGGRSGCGRGRGCVGRGKSQGLHCSLNPFLYSRLGVRRGRRRFCRHRRSDGGLHGRINVRCGFGGRRLDTSCRVAGRDRESASDCQEQYRQQGGSLEPART